MYNSSIPPQNVHPTIKKTHCDRRVQRMIEGANLDWATGETLAFGSLLQQGMVTDKCSLYILEHLTSLTSLFHIFIFNFIIYKIDSY